MKIITLNLNGIRAAIKKGLIPWLQSLDADVICCQETKMQAKDDAFMSDILPGYYAYYCDAEKKGYSGVAIFTKIKPDKVSTGLGWPHADHEGRYIQADFGNLSIVSLYLPSGSSSPDRQLVKFDFMAKYYPILAAQRNSERDYIVCGDWNIAHKQIDLKNWRSNQKNSGFLPEERAWLDQLFDDLGWIDAFRVIEPASEQYTWWSYRQRAFDKNVGWRIDYQIVSPRLKDKIKAACIHKEPRLSDHAAVWVEYDL